MKSSQYHIYVKGVQRFVGDFYEAGKAIDILQSRGVPCSDIKVSEVTISTAADFLNVRHVYPLFVRLVEEIARRPASAAEILKTVVKEFDDGSFMERVEATRIVEQKRTGAVNSVPQVMPQLPPTKPSQQSRRG